MGIDYSFQVYVHHRDAGRLLGALATLCDWTTAERTVVILPDGTSMMLPGLHGFAAGRTVTLADLIEDRHGSSFGLSLCFVQDGPLYEYRYDKDHPVDHGQRWPDDTTRVRVGLVYLSLFDGSPLLPEHWIFDFTPAASVQSRLFLSSPSIRQTFARLALSVEAPLCLMDVEEPFTIIVTAHHRQISTQVPGECLLWDTRAPAHEAYRELTALLAQSSPAPAPRWIVGPGHPDYAAFVRDLARNSGVTGAVR